MPNIETEASVHDRLRSELEELPGVRRVAVDGDPPEVLVVCEADVRRAELHPSIEEILVREGLDAEAVELLYAHPAKPAPQRRVRFVGADVDHPRANFSIARVRLEWLDAEHEGRSEGEGGGFELRVAAQATIAALHSILEGEVTFQLVGVKAVRIFDHDLIAVLLHSPQAADRRLIGFSLVLDDQYRSAALAVLNATNRLLGNYLVVE